MLTFSVIFRKPSKARLCTFIGLISLIGVIMDDSTE